MRRVGAMAAASVAAMALVLASGLAARQQKQHHPEAVKRKPTKHAVTKHSLPKTESRKATKRTDTGEAVASQSLSAHKSEVAPKRKAHHRARSHRVRLPAGPSAERIEEIQQALARSGYYQGDPTGKWDADTIDALKRFQQAKGMSSTGKLDAASLQELGLGSAVAGVGAPRPVLPAGANGDSRK